MTWVKVTVFALAACFCLALTPAERAIVSHVRELNQRQKQELEDTKAKLTWTYKELSDKEPQIAQLGVERDWFKVNYEKDHEKVLKQRATVLKLYIVVGLLVLLMGAYAFAKFYLDLPI